MGGVFAGDCDRGLLYYGCFRDYRANAAGVSLEECCAARTELYGLLLRAGELTEGVAYRAVNSRRAALPNCTSAGRNITRNMWQK